MKTKSIVTLLTAALTFAFASTASAVPASKRIGPAVKTSDAPKVERPVEHKVMKRIGPPGKGFPCNR